MDKSINNSPLSWTQMSKKKKPIVNKVHVLGRLKLVARKKQKVDPESTYNSHTK